MKVALSLEISDEQRNALAQEIAGKKVQRLATREEVRAYVEGAIGALSTRVESAGPSSGLSSSEAEVVAKLREQGKSESYIRGWVQAGRKNARQVPN